MNKSEPRYEDLFKSFIAGFNVYRQFEAEIKSKLSSAYGVDIEAEILFREFEKFLKNMPR